MFMIFWKYEYFLMYSTSYLINQMNKNEFDKPRSTSSAFFPCKMVWRPSGEMQPTLWKPLAQIICIYVGEKCDKQRMKKKKKKVLEDIWISRSLAVKHPLAITHPNNSSRIASQGVKMQKQSLLFQSKFCLQAAGKAFLSFYSYFQVWCSSSSSSNLLRFTSLKYSYSFHSCTSTASVPHPIEDVSVVLEYRSSESELLRGINVFSLSAGWRSSCEMTLEGKKWLISLVCFFFSPHPSLPHSQSLPSCSCTHPVPVLLPCVRSPHSFKWVRVRLLLTAIIYRSWRIFIQSNPSFLLFFSHVYTTYFL